MMFRPLHTIAQAATLHMIIVAEGEQLRVTLQPKPTGKDAPIPAALSLVATPEEFDAGFVDAITTWRAPATTLVKQAAAAAAQPASPAADTKASKPAAKAPAKKAAKPAPKKKAAPEPAFTEEAQPATTLAAAQEPDFQAAHGESVHRIPTADGTGPRVKVRTGRPDPADVPTVEQDRLACIADMRAYLAGNAASEKPVKPSRADYLKKFAPATGRRYERLFASFDEFVAAAQQQALPEVGEAQPNAEAQQPGEPNQTSGSNVVAAAPDAAADASAPNAGACVDLDATTEAPPVSEPTSAAPAPVTLATLQAPRDDATEALFKDEPALSSTLDALAADADRRFPTEITPGTGSFTLDII